MDIIILIVFVIYLKNGNRIMLIFYLIWNLVFFPSALTFDETNQNCKIVKDISSQYPQKNKLNYYLACIAEHDTIILVSRQNINCDSVFLTPITFGKKYTLHLRFQKNAHNPDTATSYIDMVNIRGRGIDFDFGVGSYEEYRCKEQLYIYMINSLPQEINQIPMFECLFYFTDDICNGKIREKVVIKE